MVEIELDFVDELRGVVCKVFRAIEGVASCGVGCWSAVENRCAADRAFVQKLLSTTREAETRV